MSKKNIITRFLIIILSFMIFFSTNSYTQTELEKANLIASKGIIEFTKNPYNYRLSDTITRKETMKIIMKLSGLKVNDKCEGKFADVTNDWGCKYIETALNNNYITSSSLFRPDDSITKIEILKLIIKAKGIEKIQETSNWQNDYMETAYANGIIDKKYYDYNSNAKRGWIFYAIANSINSSDNDSKGISNNTFDADGFMWGTEVYPDHIEKTKDILTNNLKIDNFKVRIQSNFFPKNGDTYSSKLCMPSTSNCKVTYDFDDTVQYFKDNNWSMIPMLTFDTTKTTVTSQDIEDYVDFVEWFVSRYKLDANIKYIELTNDPNKYWKGTNAQLIELNNETYEKIKESNPSLNVCTVGLEFWADTQSTDKGITTLEYFLDKDNNAKFDCLAFHGYPLININDVKDGNLYIYPPTKKALSNKYAGVTGILEVRKALDANGWNNKLLIDSEHIGTMSNIKRSLTDEEYSLDAAYIAQELILKRTLRNNNSFALFGIIPLKTGPRGIGDLAYGSLKSDGSITPTITAVSILWDKLNEYKWDSHISGKFDDENQVWIEKFKSDQKELYIFFKPFEYKEGHALNIDNNTLDYKLSLSKKPFSVKLTQIDGTSENITPNQSITLKSINAPQYLEINYNSNDNETIINQVNTENNTSQDDGETEQQGSISPQYQGRCGDGICGPIEKEKNVCPEDCE